MCVKPSKNGQQSNFVTKMEHKKYVEKNTHKVIIFGTYL